MHLALNPQSCLGKIPPVIMIIKSVGELLVTKPCIEQSPWFDVTLINSFNFRRLVYVSCDARAALKNFVDLCRPESKSCKGDPFIPRKVSIIIH